MNLRDFDFADLVSKKGRFSYVSWADVWDVLLQFDPDVDYWVDQFPAPGMADSIVVPYQTLPDNTAIVWVNLTFKGKTRQAYLPVMNNSNKAIENPNAMDVNKAIQRTLVKAAAAHGLGLYVYRGEDFPSDEADTDKGTVKPKEPPIDGSVVDAINAADNVDELRALWSALSISGRNAHQDIFSARKLEFKNGT